MEKEEKEPKYYVGQVVKHRLTQCDVMILYLKRNHVYINNGRETEERLSYVVRLSDYSEREFGEFELRAV